jgi:hypothetical protein
VILSNNYLSKSLHPLGFLTGFEGLSVSVLANQVAQVEEYHSR